MKPYRLSEDVFAIILGGAILLLAALTFIWLPYQEVASQYTEASGSTDFSEGDWRPPETDSPLSVFLEQLSIDLASWQFNPLQSLSGAEVAAFIGLTLVLMLAYSVGMRLTGRPALPFVPGFTGVSVVALCAYLLAGQADFSSIGLGYALWAILIGLVISNIFGIPDFLRPALQHELYVKTGLVLLGAEVLFGKILSIGLPGIFVAWIVTPVVLISTYWFGQRILRISSKTLNITVSADMSVCGVSAAIATAAACRARKEELTTAIGLSMVFTSIMMVAMPAFIRAVGMPEVLGGAWMGGTIDATGAVVAAGAFLGDTAMNVAATIKMIQNILIGVMAFAVAVYWTTRVEAGGERSVGAGEIWLRFPKFILGFIGASMVFSILHGSLEPALATLLLEDGMLDFSSDIRGWLFCLAFSSIGLSTNFRELRAQFAGGKPFILYLCGQSFNLCLTLFMAWLMFYRVFPGITDAL